jgi:hypothetical protein
MIVYEGTEPDGSQVYVGESLNGAKMAVRRSCDCQTQLVNCSLIRMKVPVSKKSILALVSLGGGYADEVEYYNFRTGKFSVENMPV